MLAVKVNNVDAESVGNLLAYEFEMLFTSQEAEVLNIVDSYM